MEKVRSIKVTIEIDSNKSTDIEILKLKEEETIKEFYRRIMNKIREMILQ